MRLLSLPLAPFCVLFLVSGCWLLPTAHARDCKDSSLCETQVKVYDDGASACKFEWPDKVFVVAKNAKPNPLRWNLIADGQSGNYEFGLENGIKPADNDESNDLFPTPRPAAKTFEWVALHKSQTEKTLPTTINVYRTFSTTPPTSKLCLPNDVTKAANYAVNLQ